MAASHEARLLEEILDLDVKDHVASYLLVPVWGTFAIGQDVKGNSDIFHFLRNGVGPEGVAILAVKFKCLCNGAGHVNPKLMGFGHESLLPQFDERYYAVTFLQGMFHPPVESWFMVNALGNGVFSSLNRITLLEVMKRFPGCRTVLPLDADFPSLGGAPVLRSSMGVDKLLVSKGQ